MSNIIQRRWATVLELVVVAVAVTVLITSVGFLQAQEQDRPSAWVHTQPVYVNAGYTAQLAFVNLANTAGTVHFVLFDVFSGEPIGESGPIDVASKTGVTFEFPFGAPAEILGVIHFEFEPGDSPDAEPDHISDGEPSDVNGVSDHVRHRVKRHLRRHRHRRPFAASLQVFDQAGKTEIYDPLR